MKRYVKATSQDRRVPYIKSDDNIQTYDLPYDQLTLQDYAAYELGIDAEDAADLFGTTEDNIRYVYIPADDAAAWIGVEFVDGTYGVFKNDGSDEKFYTKDRSKMLRYASISDDVY